MKEEWDDKNIKKSHVDKTLSSHNQEIKKIINKFLDFYSFPKEFYDIIEYIAEYHDYGKLYHKWNIDNGNKIDHSPLSVKYLRENKVIFKNKRITPLLWYLILKHHSSLTKRTRYQEFEDIIDVVKKIVRNTPFVYRVNLIDSFGLFKIADACSANNKEIELKKPIINDENVKRIISEKSLDSRRWSEQQKLTRLPDIALLRAYTGWGKTDASLLFFRDKSVNKIFYLFPTITAINKFYNKLKNVFNDNVTKYFYFYDTEVKEDLDQLQNLFFVENFINPLIITTIDQFLLSFLQVGKYYTKRVMFRNAGIIVDEVHLLNPLMLSILIYFFKKFKELYKFKVLFMSATLPESMKKYLSEELDLSKDSFLDFSEGYKMKRRVQFEYSNSDIEMQIDEIIGKFEENKKVLVVVNTVEKAVNIARKIIERTKESNIILLHARMMYRDRRSKENKIDELKHTPHILVTTQICEVSLDISYDFMFTELAPISSLIQRFGRVNRIGGYVNKTNVKIFKSDIKNKKYYPYAAEELKIAEEIVKSLSGDNLKTEMDLLKNLDITYNYNEFQRELKKEEEKINLKNFEETLQFFFSLEVSEEELLSILQYRDSFTTLVIPDPSCIEDDKLRCYIERLIKENFECKSFKQYRQLLAIVKEISVPIPIWWIKEARVERNIFPIVNFNNKVYNSFYGLVEIKSEII